MTNGTKININPPRPRILVAPLDWGLGHATRCIPIIKELLINDCEPVLAADGLTAQLLSREFPGLKLLTLKGYNIRYTQNGRWLPWRILLQTPKILAAIRSENKWLQDVIDKEGIDAIISDNRYGLFSGRIPSVIITHQLYINNRLGAWFGKWLQSLNYNQLEQFSQCWVPDFEMPYSLAPLLSHPVRMPRLPVTYLGGLSRFQPVTATEDIDCLVLLSGPEPQRSILEEMILKEGSKIPGRLVMVSGRPGAASQAGWPENTEIHTHLPAEELNRLVARSRYIISRSGYTTVMDMFKLQKKCIFIPTPGQPEQEYLARFLEDKKLALAVIQKDFDLKSAMDKALQFPYRHIDPPGGWEAYRAAVQSFSAALKQRKGAG